MKVSDLLPHIVNLAMSKIKSKNSVNFTAKDSGLQAWIRDFSQHLKANPDKNVVIYPTSFATGFAKVHLIEPGLTYRIVDYLLNTDFIFVREKAQEFYLIIYFYQYSNCAKLRVTVNNKVVIDSSENDYSSLLMTNSRVHQKLELKSGTYVKGLTIQLTEQWLLDKIARPDTANYALFKEKEVFQSFISPKAQKLLTEIFNRESNSPAPGLYLNNRVLRLLEGFLEHILKNGISAGTLPPSAKDVQNILKVESMLLENYNMDFPSIEKLARVALMSQTKLKNVFKKAFGVNMYQYYQKNRIHKAKEMLDTGRYTVSEVGGMIGYQNLSNFSSAFKKEFRCLPKDFRKIG
jgi:AraC-like DNA-binding protein